MNENEWLACTDPMPMLEYLRGQISERKARLFAGACCRDIWHHMRGPLREVVEVGERHADGLASEAESEEAAELAIEQGGESDPLSMAAWNMVALCTEPDDPLNIASATAAEVNQILNGRLAQCHLVRCLFGNPFRPVAPDPAWQMTNVVTLARTIYEERQWELLPLLADLLEEAGCSKDVSDHCRGGGPHARGCWVVDLVLGKS